MVFLDAIWAVVPTSSQSAKGFPTLSVVRPHRQRGAQWHANEFIYFSSNFTFFSQLIAFSPTVVTFFPFSMFRV